MEVRKPGRPKKVQEEATPVQVDEQANQEVAYRPPFRAQLTPEGWVVPEQVTAKEPK